MKIVVFLSQRLTHWKVPNRQEWPLYNPYYVALLNAVFWLVNHDIPHCKGQRQHSIFFLFCFTQWGESLCSSRQLHGEKATLPASVLGFFEPFLCSFEHFKVKNFLALLKKSAGEATSTFLQWAVYHCVVVSMSSALVGSSQRRRSWCWLSLCTQSYMICPKK